MRFARITLLAVALGVAGLVTLCLQRPVALADALEPAHAEPVAPADALRRLRDGNERFVNQKATASHNDGARREEVAKVQHPFAIVLGCADSRVPPELVFDQGLGDLFVIRVAGEVAPPEVIGSIEYAVEHLGCRTVVVLGHARCGAVEAALGSVGGPAPEGNLGQLIKDITPVIEQIDKSAPNALATAVDANAKAVAGTIASRSKMLGAMAQKGDLMIIPARYELDTGKVEFMRQ
jgi:carbonic anhydrase